MNRFKISTRVAFLAGLLSLFVLAMGSLGLWGIHRSNDALQSMYEKNLQSMGQIDQIQTLLLRNRLALAVALVTPDDATITASTTEVQTNIATITNIWNTYMAHPRSAEETLLANSFAEHRARFVQQGLQPTIAALQAGDTATAQHVVTQIVRPLYEPVGERIHALVQQQLDQAQKAHQEAQERYTTIRAARGR